MIEDKPLLAFPSPLSGGMALRDYFAAKAMAAAIQSPHRDYIVRTDGVKVYAETSDVVAELAYAYADAMLKAREK